MAKTPTVRQIVPLYKGTVQIEYLPNSHRYIYEGENLISVTRALSSLAKPQLIPWAVRQATEYLQQHIGETLMPGMLEEAAKQHVLRKTEGAETGSIIHDWCHHYIMGHNPSLPNEEKALHGIMAFLSWVEKMAVKFIFTERIVFSKAHRYVGTLDAVAIVNGRKSLVDFKTSRGLYPEMRFQTAAYQKALEEEGETFDGLRVIVRFDKETGGFEPHFLDDIDADFAAFLGLLTVKRRELILEKL